MKNIASIFILIMVFGLYSANANIIQLSDYSSDETPAEELDALIDFSVVGSTLTIEVTNLTDGPDGSEDAGYDIMAVYFNATDNVTGLSLTSPASGWTLYSLSNDTKAGGFGQFDFALIDGTGNDPHQIDGEAAETFTIIITGSGVSASSFSTEMSIIPTGNNPMLVAAKFVNGPGDDSAFGASIPEPVTIALLGLGSLMLLRKRKTACSY